MLDTIIGKINGSWKLYVSNLCILLHMCSLNTHYCLQHACAFIYYPYLCFSSIFYLKKTNVLGDIGAAFIAKRLYATFIRVAE